jgi:hypothetical protein
MRRRSRRRKRRVTAATRMAIQKTQTLKELNAHVQEEGESPRMGVAEVSQAEQRSSRFPVQGPSQRHAPEAARC